MLDQANPPVAQFAHNLPRPVSRCVVHDDDFVFRRKLAQDRMQLRRNESLAIVTGHADRNSRPFPAALRRLGVRDTLLHLCTPVSNAFVSREKYSPCQSLAGQASNGRIGPVSKLAKPTPQQTAGQQKTGRLAAVEVAVCRFGQQKVLKALRRNRLPLRNQRKIVLQMHPSCNINPPPTHVELSIGGGILIVKPEPSVASADLAQRRYTEKRPGIKGMNLAPDESRCILPEVAHPPGANAHRRNCPTSTKQVRNHRSHCVQIVQPARSCLHSNKKIFRQLRILVKSEQPVVPLLLCDAQRIVVGARDAIVPGSCVVDHVRNWILRRHTARRIALFRPGE